MQLHQMENSEVGIRADKTAEKHREGTRKEEATQKWKHVKLNSNLLVFKSYILQSETLRNIAEINTLQAKSDMCKFNSCGKFEKESLNFSYCQFRGVWWTPWTYYWNSRQSNFKRSTSQKEVHPRPKGKIKMVILLDNAQKKGLAALCWCTRNFTTCLNKPNTFQQR